MTGRWIRVGGLTLGIAAAAAYFFVLVVFQIGKRRLVAELEAGGRVVITDRGRIEYAREGSGPPVLILPGTFGGYDQARSTGRNLTPQGFEIVAVSRPGYLRTPIETGRTPAEQADAFAMLLDSLGLDRVGVVGTSGGSPSALELASRHPNRVAGLVLISGLSGPKAQAPAQPPRLTKVTDRLFGEGFLTWWQLLAYERQRERVLESPIFGADSRRRLAADPAKLDRYLELAWYRFPPARRWEGYANDREQFGAFSFSGFGAITAATLVVHGTQDRNAPIEHGDRAAREIRGAEYFRIEGGDHFSSIARAEEVWGRVAAFLRRASERSHP